MSEFNEELIIKHLDNSLSENEEQLLLEWLQISEKNRDVFLLCKNIYATRKIRHYSNPLVLDQALRKFNQCTETIQKQRKRHIIVRLSKYAAVLFITVAISYLTWYIVHPSDTKYNTLYVNKNGPVKKVVLPDGTKVWINNGSSFTYPLTFDEDSRIVKLSGEAFFEVKTDTLHPFIVNASTIQVKVYGTSFNVNTNTADSTVQTTLVTGRVAINDLKGNRLSMLSPGQMALYKNDLKKLELYYVNTDVYTLWRNGLIVFDKASLTEITEKIESLYNVRITVNVQHRLQNKINFVFCKTQELDTVMGMLEFVAPIKYKKYENQIFINAK